MNKRLITLWCLLFAFAVASVRAQVIRLTVADFKGKAEYVARDGHKHPLKKGVQLTDESLLYIPYNGEVTLVDETENKYTLKSLGWSSIEDKMKDTNNTVLSRSKDYVKAVLAQFRGQKPAQVQYISDPCTVTREYYDADAKLEEVPGQKKQTNNFRSSFDDFKKNARKEYDDFRKKAFKEYREFVRQAWKEYGVEEPIAQPEEQEVEPMLVPDADQETASWFSKLFRKKDKSKDKEDKKQKEEKKQAEAKRDRNPKGEALSYKETIAAVAPKPQPKPLSEVQEVPQNANTFKSFKIFGTEFKVRIGDDCRFKLKSTSNNDVADAMEIFEKPQFDNLLHDCLKMRDEHHMSDWAYYQMLLALTDMFYGQDTNEAALVLAFLYSQSGYKMRLACYDNGLQMLVASEHIIYNTSFIHIDGYNYYMFKSGDRKMMNICQAKFPKEGPMSLRITAAQDLDMAAAPERTITSVKNPDFSFTVTSNKNYMDFFDTYPSSCINDNFMTRWAMYANTPLEKGLTQQLYPAMKKKLEGLTEKDAVQQLLWWVQTGFKYEYDEKVWGRDRAFFGEESVFYPYCDCEDRSILLSHLVRDLLGLKVILIYYPGHLAMAVNFHDDVPGDYIMKDGLKFVVCDPTYIGSNVGETMPSMKGTDTTVILLENS